MMRKLAVLSAVVALAAPSAAAAEAVTGGPATPSWAGRVAPHSVAHWYGCFLASPAVYVGDRELGSFWSVRLNEVLYPYYGRFVTWDGRTLANHLDRTIQFAATCAVLL